MRFPALAFSGRHDGDGRRLAFQIRPSAKQVVGEALKRDAAQRRAATARARLIEKAEASGYSSAQGVNPLERAALVNRLRKPEMTGDEVDEIVSVVDAYGRPLVRLTGVCGSAVAGMPQADQRKIERRGRPSIWLTRDLLADETNCLLGTTRSPLALAPTDERKAS
jgi:hypothetical protein